ncbi:T9SS type A sorting domain-containing protein, partial [Flavobacterium undicola]|uniref:T9SS type A sorting domain-containing protein n=1 Tax=Flavobacterium undicola TaxID=1932779 RepID=UPI0013784A0C
FVAATGMYTPGLDATTSTFKYLLSATAPCVADFSIATVNINSLPISLVLTGSTICDSAPGTGTVTSTTSQLGVSYQLRIGTTPVQTAKAGTGAALLWTNLNAGTNYNVVSTGAAPTNCPGGSNSVDVSTEVCGGPLCTYTQGAYGNYGGKYCDGTTGGIVTFDLITQAIKNAGNSITVGKTGASVVMGLGDEDCIIAQMPGGGKATEIFPAGNYDICPSLPNSFLKNGRINNVLLSQTIALSLNVNITNPSQLGSFILQAGTLATAKPEGGCGSSVAKPRVCGHFEDNVWVGTENEYTYRTFSAAVINAINGDKTIAGLLDLANRALANSDNVKNSEDGVSLSEIAGAVAAVNEVFDECAIAVGWDIEKCPEPPTLDLSSVTTAKISSVETASFTAYPVPFKDQLTIKYNFDYTSDVKIEVFNSKGIIVYSMTDTDSFLGKEVTIIINNTLQQQQVYYVRLTTSQGSTVKSVMSSY